MLRLSALIKLDVIYLDNTYYKVQVQWNDGDDWLPDKKSIIKENDYYKVTTTCLADLLLIFVDLFDLCEIEAINLIVEDNNLKHKLQILTGQVEGSKPKILNQSSKDPKEVERLASFFRSSANIAVY